MTLNCPSAHGRLCPRNRRMERSPCHVRRILLEGQRSAVNRAHCQRPEQLRLQSYHLLHSRTASKKSGTAAATSTGSECPHEVPAEARRSAWRGASRHCGLQHVRAIGFCSWGAHAQDPSPFAARRPRQKARHSGRFLAACTQECLVGPGAGLQDCVKSCTRASVDHLRVSAAVRCTPG